jgi:hypothetical protein
VTVASAEPVIFPPSHLANVITGNEGLKTDIEHATNKKRKNQIKNHKKLKPPNTLNLWKRREHYEENIRTSVDRRIIIRFHAACIFRL